MERKTRKMLFDAVVIATVVFHIGAVFLTDYALTNHGDVLSEGNPVVQKMLIMGFPMIHIITTSILLGATMFLRHCLFVSFPRKYPEYGDVTDYFMYYTMLALMLFMTAYDFLHDCMIISMI